MPALLLLLLALALPRQAAAQALEQGQLCRAAIATVEREASLPPRLLAAIGRVESGRRDPGSGAFHPWPWTINAEGRGSFFPDKAAAIAAVRQLQAQGVRSIDVGCLQINLRHHPNAFASLEEAFDPLANARYAARFLNELQATRGDWMVTASHYHSQTPEFASAYRTRVTAALLAEQGTPEAPTAAMAALRPQPPQAAPPVSGGGGFMLSNGADRAAVMPAAPGTVGRGLDAYRALPIPLAGRTPIAGARRL
ncbi:transglycosylase SLT domain-containing protein [Siccirubricoccus sp. KC 17139]|uniref:Transglycosylase SLT domain-containing protein n=1 Tax=Siccirubricoccus soli TaxID=2899147 RepID=A0ABT1D528_9PROT|nr:transglycosylase SLT domain-containing protein [Siccirubricoccus soli]MCO6417027.1 transglycosylase SLT domain-containing protein [Siccirubricoccus soli]MCP2683162.1 transglycosylase SLT domain-containing protein [Siccirubricoccus soli]